MRQPKTELSGSKPPLVTPLRSGRTLTAHAARAGVDALLIVTPYYIRPPQRAGLLDDAAHAA